MELRRYWDIIRRHLWIVLALPLLVGVASLALFLLRPASYTAESRVQLTLIPPQGAAPDAEFFRYDSYYNYLATEYATDDLVEVLNGNVFCAAVAGALHAAPFDLAAEEEQICGALVVTRKHRVLTFQATADDRDRALAIARAAVATMGRDPVQYFSRGNSGARLEAAPLTIDRPLATEIESNRITGLFNVALQTLIALAAGLGLAFLLEYLDTRLRDADGARDALGLPVLGQLPHLATAGRGPGPRVGRNGRHAAS